MLKILSGVRPARPLPSSLAWTMRGLTEDMWALILECWLDDPAARPGMERIIVFLDSVRPEDRRLVENMDVTTFSASFRKSLGRDIGMYSLSDLEALIDTHHIEPGSHL